MSFTWNGVSSDNMEILVEHYPNVPIPVRRQTLLTVPGRSGGVLVAEPTFDNVTLNYDIFIQEASNMAVVSRTVLEWLLVPGYHELTDSYDTGITRFAFFNTDASIESILNRFGRVTLSFSARPERYITTALVAEAYSAPLDNPTQNDAKPLIICHGSGSGQLTVGNTIINFADSEIVLDCETQQAYYDGNNMNNQMTGDFPTLPPGSTGITYSGGITSVEVAPRWYYL